MRRILLSELDKNDKIETKQLIKVTYLKTLLDDLALINCEYLYTLKYNFWAALGLQLQLQNTSNDHAS